MRWTMQRPLLDVLQRQTLRVAYLYYEQGRAVTHLREEFVIEMVVC